MFDSKLANLKKKIFCDNDCMQSGCPGHIIKLEIETTSSSAQYIKDDKLIFSMDSNEGIALFDLLNKVHLDI